MTKFIAIKLVKYEMNKRKTIEYTRASMEFAKVNLHHQIYYVFGTMWLGFPSQDSALPGSKTILKGV